MDKDQSFDKLLQQVMPTGEKPAGSGSCLDAETLAAWSSHSLSASERASAEMHIADCDRCLSVLAAVAKTDPSPSAAPSRRWFSVGWMVPAATAAVAMAAWVLIRQPEEPRRSASVGAPPAAVDALHDAPRAPAPTAPASPVLQRPKEQLQARAANDSLRKDMPADRPAAKAAAPAAAPASPSPARTEAAESRGFAAAQEKKDERSVIRSPQGASEWRIDGSAVERSLDSGRTWRAQATGTTTDLTAGASPAPTICWIVGRKGTVLLTTDGASWRLVPFPDAEVDLVAVTARNAEEATVTTASGRTYRTTDAGKTWTLQENPPAPF